MGFQREPADDAGKATGRMIPTGVFLSEIELEEARQRERILKKHFEWYDALAERLGLPPPPTCKQNGVEFVAHYGMTDNGQLLRWSPE